MRLKPKAGIAFTSVEGYDVDQDKLTAFKGTAKKVLDSMELENVHLDYTVQNLSTAKKANELFKKEDIDVLILIVGIWTPDSTVGNLINSLNVPIIVYTTSLSVYAVSVDGAHVIAAALKEFGRDFKFIFGDIESGRVQKKINDYAFAAGIVKKLKSTRIGIVGGVPDIMLSLEVDSFSVKNIFGPTVAPIDFYKIDHYMDGIDKNQVSKRMSEIKDTVGNITVNDEVLEESVNYYFAVLDLVKDMELDAITINCFPMPELKGKTCLATSNLNDIGIMSACEGDINATLVMLIFNMINGKAPMHSDVIIENAEENALMFSHCGGGPFSCASSPGDIMLEEQYEIKDGMAVYYPVKKGGEESTMVNLAGRESTYRVCIMNGISIPTKELVYHGNPLQVKFKTGLEEIIETIGNGGFSHHWGVAYGDYRNIVVEICKLLKLNDPVMID